MQPEPQQRNHPEPQANPSMQPDPSMQPTTTEPKQSKGVADEVSDIIDNEEEYVGVNDEHMYISIAPA